MAAKPPLSVYLGALPDLARRLAATLHLAAIAGGDGNPSREVTTATVKRAAAIVNAAVLPVAQALLGPISISEVERDARRLVQHLRTLTSAKHRELARRPQMRAWQHSMATPRFDAAVGLLVECGLLEPLDKAGCQFLKVTDLVHADAEVALSTAPRRRSGDNVTGGPLTAAPASVKRHQTSVCATFSCRVWGRPRQAGGSSALFLGCLALATAGVTPSSAPAYARNLRQWSHWCACVDEIHRTSNAEYYSIIAELASARAINIAVASRRPLRRTQCRYAVVREQRLSN